MGKLYKFGYCAICKRQLIVQNVNDLYVCDFCKREQEKQQRDNMSEHEKQHALMFANYATQSKCKRNNVVPCEICKAAYNDCGGYE